VNLQKGAESWSQKREKGTILSFSLVLQSKCVQRELQADAREESEEEEGELLETGRRQTLAGSCFYCDSNRRSIRLDCTQRPSKSRCANRAPPNRISKPKPDTPLIKIRFPYCGLVRPQGTSTHQRTIQDGW